MTLQRSLVRARAITVIKAANIVPPGNIFRAKIWKAQPLQMPCLTVFTRTDDQENKGHTAEPSFLASVTLDFELGLKGDDPAAIEDQCDTMCQQLIEAVMTDPLLISMVERVVSIKTAIDAGEGEFQYFRARISITFEYTEIYPPNVTTDLNLIDMTFKGPNGDVFAEVKILPQSS
jgi:hypothetical protein